MYLFVFQKPGGIDISPEDTLISYLPLAHSYERLLEVHSIHVLLEVFLSIKFMSFLL